MAPTAPDLQGNCSPVSGTMSFVRCWCIEPSPRRIPIRHNLATSKLPAQRGVEVSYETIRCWTIKFGPQIARNPKRRRPPSPLAGAAMRCSERMYIWRAADDEGEVLDLVVQTRRDHAAAPKLLIRLLRNQPASASVIDVLAAPPREFGYVLAEVLDGSSAHARGQSAELSFWQRLNLSRIALSAPRFRPRRGPDPIGRFQYVHLAPEL